MALVLYWFIMFVRIVAATVGNKLIALVLKCFLEILETIIQTI